MLTLKEWHEQSARSTDHYARQAAEMLMQPNPLIEGYEPTPLSWLQRVRNRIGRPFIDLGVKIMGEYAPYIE